MSNSTTEISDVVSEQFVKRSRKIFNHSLVFVSGNLFLVVAGLAFRIYAARTIGADAFGIFGLAMTVVNFFTLVSSFGLAAALARFIPTYLAKKEPQRARMLTKRALIVLAGTTIVAGAVMVSLNSWISMDVYKNSALATYLPIFVLMFAASQFSDFCSQGLRGHQEVARRTVITTFYRFIVKALVTIGLFLAGWGLWGYIVGELVALGSGAVILGYYLWKFTPKATDAPKPPTPTFDREVVSFAGSMFGINWLDFLYKNIDKIVLGIFFSATDVGVYGLAVSIAAYLPTCLMAVSSILGPTIAELHTRGESVLLGRLFRMSVKWMVALTWPIAAVIVIDAEKLLGLFGAEFRVGATVLGILAVGELINVATGSVGGLLLMSGNQKMEVIARCLNVVVTMPLYLILVPRMGAVGAALSYSTGNILINVTRVWFVYMRVKLIAYDREFVKVVLALCLGSIAVVVLNSALHQVGDVTTLVLGTLTAYLVSAVGLWSFAVTKDDRAVFASIFQRFRRQSSPAVARAKS